MIYFQSLPLAYCTPDKFTVFSLRHRIVLYALVDRRRRTDSASNFDESALNTTQPSLLLRADEQISKFVCERCAFHLLDQGAGDYFLLYNGRQRKTLDVISETASIAS